MFKRKSLPPVSDVDCLACEQHNLLSRFDKFKAFIVNTKFPLLIELLKWVVIDNYRRIKYGKRTHLYGIWCFIGIYGGGKTISLVEYLERMRQKYGDEILIASNFFYSGEDFSITHWEDLLKEYDKPVIFAYDEIQNEFNSREYRSFPMPLMSLLTQNRKGNGKQIIYTAQDYETVDKNFRRLTTTIVVCRTFFKRLTYCRYYARAVYENYISVTDIGRKSKLRPYMTKSFVQSDYIRSRFDSYKMLQSARNKQCAE